MSLLQSLWRRAVTAGIPPTDRVYQEIRSLMTGEALGVDVRPWLQPIELYIARREIPQLAASIWEEPDPAAVRGEFRIGLTAQTGQPLVCGLTWDDLARGVLICGAIGYGKTNLAIRLARQILNSGQAHSLFIDPKADYVWLCREHPELDVYQESNLQLNPFEPPEGLARELWFAKAADIFSAALQLMQGSYSTLANAIRAVSEIAEEASEGEAPLLPTIAAIRDYLDGMLQGKFGHRVRPTGVQKDYIDRILTRLQNICETLPHMAEVSQGLTIDGSRSAVLDVSGIGQPTASVVAAQLIIMGIYLRRLLTGYRRERPDLIVIADEGQQLVGQYQESPWSAPFSPMGELAMRCREMGIGFLYLMQSPGTLMKSVRANIGTKVTFALADGEDVDLMAKSMSLTPEQKAAMGGLSIGEAIVKKQGVPAAPVRTDYEAVDKSISAAEIEAHMRPRLMGRTIVTAPPLEELWQRLQRVREAREAAQHGPHLTLDEEAVLRYVLDREPQRLGKTELCKLCPLGRERTLTILASLEERKMIYCLSRKVSPRAGQGQPRRVYYLDNEGAQYLRLDRHSHRFGSVGKGGWLHRTMVGEAMLWWRDLGYQVTTEYSIRGSRETVDLVIEAPQGQKRVAVEVECNADQALDNIEKCLRAEFTGVWVVPKNGRVREVIEGKLGGQPDLKRRAEGRVDLLRDIRHLFHREEL